MKKLKKITFKIFILFREQEGKMKKLASLFKGTNEEGTPVAKEEKKEAAFPGIKLHKEYDDSVELKVISPK